MIALFAEIPALPLHTAGKYVAAAYIVFLLVVVIYVAIMGKRLVSSQREIIRLRDEIEARERTARDAAGPAGPAAANSVSEPESETVA